MIIKCDAKEIQTALLKLKKNPVKNIYGISYISGFPFNDDYYKAYKTDTGYCVVMGDALHLYSYSDTDEIDSFIGITGVNAVYDYQCSSAYGKYDRADIFALDNDDKLLFGTLTEKCNASDEDEIYCLWKKYFPGTPDRNVFDITAIEQRCYLHGRRCKITDGGKIISTASVLMENDISSLLGGIVTDPDYRGSGLAGQTVSFMAKEILNSGKIPVVFTINETAKRLYRHLGFEKIGCVDIIRTNYSK